MITSPVPWSWRAVALSGLIMGGLLLPLQWGVDLLRVGLDADMNMRWATYSFWDVSIMGVLPIGATFALALVAGFWLSRLFKLGVRGLFTLTIAPSSVAVLVITLQPTTLVADQLIYPPTWLMPLSIAVTLAAGVAAYLDAVRLFKAHS